jgi:hypothetical protein
VFIDTNQKNYDRVEVKRSGTNYEKVKKFGSVKKKNKIYKKLQNGTSNNSSSSNSRT